MFSIQTKTWFSFFVQRIKSFSRNKKLLQKIESELFFLKSKPINSSPKKGTLLVKCDDIGDFLVWQQTISFYKKQAAKPIYFVGNSAWKNLYETFFSFADETVWIDKSKWNDPDYRNSMYEKMASFSAETAISTLFTRNLFIDDLLVISSQSKQKIAWNIEHHIHFPTWTRFNKIFTTLISSEKKYELEYFRNLEMIEKIYGICIPKKIEPIKIALKRNNYLVVVPRASVASKSWKVQNIIELIKNTAIHFDEIILLGGRDALLDCAEIVLQLPHLPINNLCGKTTLSEMWDVITNAKFVVSPDTAALHMAILAETPIVAMSNGTLWQRFTNYSPYVKSYYKLVVPPHISLNENKLKIMYTRSEINEIKPSVVVQEVEIFLNRI